LKTLYGRQSGHGGRIERMMPVACLRVAQIHEAALEVDVIPAKRFDFRLAHTREHEKTDNPHPVHMHILDLHHIERLADRCNFIATQKPLNPARWLQATPPRGIGCQQTAFLPPREYGG